MNPAPRTPSANGSGIGIGIGPEPSCASTKRQRDRAGASIGSDQTSPSRTARKPYPPPSFPARAGPIPRSPRRDLDPQRQPRHSATAKQVRAPECMRRSFRTLWLCAISGVSPRAGMRCPVGALRTAQLPRAPGPRVRRQRNLTRTQNPNKETNQRLPNLSQPPQAHPSGSGTGLEQA